MDSKRRVLFLSSCVRGGGAGWSLYYLLKNLDRQRFEPLVVVPDRGIFDDRFRELQVRVETPGFLFPHRVLQQLFPVNNEATRAASATINLGRLAGFTAQLASMIRKERVDLVYCNNMLVKPLGALAAQMTGAPCVLHVRNIHESLPATTFYGAVASLPSVKRIIANSSASAVPYRKTAPGKVHVVHNGIDLGEYDRKTVGVGRFRQARGLQNLTLVGFTGMLDPRKGLVPLIKAAAKILPGRPDVRFVVLGEVPVGLPVDYLAEYRALAAEQGIADRFLFLGFVDDVRAAVADFDVLVLPSFQEPFGRSIIEAMALDTPVVATSVGGIPEIIDDGQHGLLVPPGDVDALAGAIASLVDSPPLRQKLGRAGRQRVEERFDVARLTRDIEALFDEAIEAVIRRAF